MRNKNDKIERIIREKGIASIEDLVECLGISNSTARRYIHKISQNPFFEKTNGGIKYATVINQDLLMDYVSVYKLGVKRQEIAIIADEAFKSIKKGDVIGLSGGRFCHFLALRLRESSGVTVVTNSIDIASELICIPEIQVMVTGGRLNNFSFELVGRSLEASVQHININKFFIGTSGISIEKGLTSLDEAEAEAIKVIHARSEKTIVMADHKKFDRNNFALALKVEEIDEILTSDLVTKKVIEEFRLVGFNIKVVPIDAERNIANGGPDL